MQLNTYLSFNGRCEEAFRFYEQCLGGKIEGLFSYGESPMADHVSPEWRSKVMHCTLTAGNQVLMGADAPPGQFTPAGGFSVSVNLDDAAEADRIFNALSKNADVKMPLQQTFWALRFGMLVDQFGIPWMVNCQAPPQK